MAGGALEDFSRRPLQYKVLVFVGIGALLGLLYWQFMLSPLRKERDEALADLEGQKAEQDRLKAQKKQYDDLVAAETSLKDEVEQNQKALPTEAEIPAFLDMLARKTSESGVEGLKRDVRASVLIQAGGPSATPPGPGAPPPPPGGAVAPAEFIKVPVEIEMTGTFYQLKKFFSSLRPRRSDPNAPPPAPGTVQEKDRIVTIDSLTITDPKVKNNEIVLTARFVASTFRAKQSVPVPGATPPPPPPGAAPAPAPGAAPATGTGASTGTAVPGVAAKPDTMKAKTEKAMEAQESRTQKAAESDGEKLPRDSTAPVPPGGN
jgi:Tfp pilus assembly protein PilO